MPKVADPPAAKRPKTSVRNNVCVVVGGGGGGRAQFHHLTTIAHIEMHTLGLHHHHPHHHPLG